jgi:hypothetical protein
MDEERQAFEYVEGKEAEAEEWANNEDGCPCSGATEFCNNDGGANIGFCEACPPMPEDCSD